MKKKIINFTPTGTQPTRQNSNAPLTSNEIIEEVHFAFELGITTVHIHARDEEYKNTWRLDVYNQIIEGIRKYCPNLLRQANWLGRNTMKRRWRQTIQQGVRADRLLGTRLDQPEMS